MILPILLGGLLWSNVVPAQSCRPLRSTNLVSYCGVRGTTRLEFRGTPLLPDAKGRAKVERKKGYLEIETKMEHVVPSDAFGAVYLTYVLWAIPPDGRPVNLGEIVLNESNHGKLEVLTELEAFGLIVTAEPYFAVTQPSDIVVLEESAAETSVQYEVLPRGYYMANLRPVDVKGIGLITFKPRSLNEAQNAVRIARWANAGEYAPDALVKAECWLQAAEERQAVKPLDPDSEDVALASRAAVQAAEDARLMAVMRQKRSD
jgi:hypothetical protein